MQLGLDGSMQSKIAQMKPRHTKPDMLLIVNVKGQVMVVYYKKTFSPTANMTSIRALMQMAAQYNLDIHQINVNTANLHAPFDCEIYIKQLEGFEVKN